MPIQDRDYIRGTHPPNCSCAECTNRRLSKIRRGTDEDHTYGQPAFRRSTPRKTVDNIGGQKPHSPRPHIPNKLKPMLLVAALSIGGLIASRVVGTLIPFWLLLGFSIFYSIEKWFYYITRRYRVLGKLYRLLLNLSILSLFGLLIWSGIKLFSQQFVQSPLFGSIIFIAEFAFFIWMCRVIARNGWRRPSMKLTVFSIICVFLVLAFAGMQPLVSYKDKTISYAGEVWHSITTPSQSPTEQPDETTPEFVVEPLPEEPVLTDPSWADLKDFLYEDDTDEMEYVYPTTVCYDFAQRLQKNAKASGWRCAFVEVKLEGYPDWYGYGIPSGTGHALNAFQTTDKGLVYVDCTAAPGYSGNADKTVDVKVGGHYIPKSIFPEPGWSSTWGNMGTILDVQIHW